jgi:hypothetical protein
VQNPPGAEGHGVALLQGCWASAKRMDEICF